MKIEISDIDMKLKTVCEKMSFLKEIGYMPYFEISPAGEVKIVFIKIEEIKKVEKEEINLGIEFLDNEK